MQAPPHSFDTDDFEYVYQKNSIANQSLDECLALYIPYKLKIAAARDAGLHTLPEIKNEWMQYRDQLAAKCLTDTVINRYLLREAYDRSCYTIRAAYILATIQKDDSLSAYNKILQIRSRALDGEDFGELAAGCSDDHSAKINKGMLDEFTVFEMDYHFETAAYNTPAGQVSDPVRIANGYFIIKIIDRKERGQAVSFGEAKTTLRRKIANNDRIFAGMEMYATDLKTKNRFKENRASFRSISSVDTNRMNDPLFTIAEQSFDLSDFEKFVIEQPFQGTREQAYRQFVVRSLLDYESSRFETDNDAFRKITDEFLDGLLLFAITDSVVWSKVARDSAGMKAYYKKNMRSFRWKKRMNATIYYCSSVKVAERLHQAVKNKNEGNGYLPGGLFTYFCDENVSPCVDTVRRTIPKGAKTMADHIKWKKGGSKILEWNGKFVFLDVHAIHLPARKTFEEARSEVIARFQDETERKWVEELKKTYPVTIDQNVWADLKKKYAKL